MITKINLQDRTIKSYAIRKLTPFECFRLMGVRDAVIRIMQSVTKRIRKGVEVKEPIISASQQYKQAGNSIVVDVLTAIYENIWFPMQEDNGGSQLSLFDAHQAEPQRRYSGATVNILTTFSGYDSQLMAADVLKERHPEFKWRCVGWSEIDKYACQMHNLVFPQYADKALGDITKIDWQAVKDSLGGEETDLFTYSSPCFVAGTMVLTDMGFSPIEDLQTNNRVLTHSNSYNNILDVMKSRYNGFLYRINAMCSDDIVCTPDHPFYVRTMYRHGHKSLRAFKPAKWKAAKYLTKNDYVGIAVNPNSKLPYWEGTIDDRFGHSVNRNTLSEKFSDGNFWYLMGRYIGDGWRKGSSTGFGIVICCSERNTESLRHCLKQLEYNYTESHERTVTKLTISSKELFEFAERYGHLAHGKKIDGDTMNLPIGLLSRFIDGYMDSDGCIVGKYHKITTTSRLLAYGIVQCVAKVYHAPAKLYYTKRSSKHTIEGRDVNQHDTYQVVWKGTPAKQDKAFYENGYIWCPIHNIDMSAEPQSCYVYNIEVESDHSYTANGVIVHNCQDVSQAGKQAGLKEGSGTRSSLVWYVAKAIEVLKPKYLLMENVAALVSKKFMPDFSRWCQHLESLGYVNVWARLNAKDFNVPQNRDRVFVLSMRKDVAFNYKFPQPMKLSKTLESVLEEEVDERYFLNDEQVGKFLKANDKDDAAFIQFSCGFSHEAAMFIKTWLRRRITELDLWQLSAVGMEQAVLSFRDELLRDYFIGKCPSDFFAEYKYNLGREKGDPEWIDVNSNGI